MNKFNSNLIKFGFIFPSPIILIFLVSSMFANSNSYGIELSGTLFKSSDNGLKSNTIQLSTPWKLLDNRILTINIANSNLISHDKINVIRDAILSEDKIKIDNFGPNKQVVPLYFKGWMGALESAATNTTKFQIPSKFVFVESKDADITIDLTNESSQDGYSAYTLSILKADHILKTHITIYKVDEYSADRLGGIVRNEFGHALGIGHSTDPEDLKYYVPETEYPYISVCDIDAIHFLYDGKKSSLVCK